MKTSIIIHGHFYQPPRENPSTGLIPKQIENSKFMDWNQVINDSCYSANAHSRYLGPDGKIKDIVNNYAYISWNFGPTLLRWFDHEVSQLPPLLKEANMNAFNRTGHGCGIAQGFGHSILPLDSPRMRKIQIDWGIEDFIYRFGLYPEGFWCPECAINEDVIDALAQKNIKFVILSPWQAKAIENEDGQMIDLLDQPAPCDEPFIIEGKTHSIVAFFYHPGLASDVSFGHLLRDADNFYNKLIEIKRNSKEPLRLLHYATDGEIYGHHEGFGNMGLTALIKKIQASDEFELTNYGSYLESHPATKKALLKSGDENLGTSWSCCHGVGRWMRDCGCSTGGKENWNQAFRTPLREAFNKLEKEVFPVIDTQIKKMGCVPEKLIENYAKVVIGKKTASEFVDLLMISSKQKKELTKLLYCVKTLLFSFTSCAWFFNDVSGIETKQNIQYALDTIKNLGTLLPSTCLSEFLETLSKAKSNIASEGNGKTIALKINNQLRGELEALLAAYLYQKPNKKLRLKTYGCYSIKRSKDNWILDNNYTLEQYVFNISEKADSNTIIIKELSSNQKVINFNLKDLPPRLTSLYISHLEKQVTAHQKNLFDEIGRTLPLIEGINAKNIEESVFATCIGAIKQFCKANIDKFIKQWDREKNSFRIIAKFLNTYGSQRIKVWLIHTLSSNLDKIANDLSSHGYNEQNLLFCYDYLKTIREAGIQPDITQMQNAVFPYLKDKRFEKIAIDLNFDLD